MTKSNWKNWKKGRKRWKKTYSAAITTRSSYNKNIKHATAIAENHNVFDSNLHFGLLCCRSIVLSYVFVYIWDLIVLAQISYFFLSLDSFCIWLYVSVFHFCFAWFFFRIHCCFFLVCSMVVQKGERKW